MPRLSSPIADLQEHYDVVVVGSGYGGAVAACRLARAQTAKRQRLKICILERGRELQPGDYPDTLAGVIAESQVDSPGGHFRSRSALYDFRLNPDLNVVLGCGLGGTSLINANVALPPERWVLEDPAWPKGLHDDINKGLAEGFMLADAMLDAVPFKDRPGVPRLAKLGVLEEAAGAFESRPDSGFVRPHINVSFRESVKRFHGKSGALEIAQHACQLCGDCVSGCNYGAKKSLLMNYLPDARAHGATMFTEVGVRRLDRRDGRWRVHYELLNAGRERFGPPEMMVTADIVILAAGTLGSTEILRRSQKEGLGEELTLSAQVGMGFSGNGDLLGLAYNMPSRANSIGAGRPRPTPGEAPGPCIAGTIHLRDPNIRDHDLVIEEGVIPGALAKVMPLLLGGAAFIYGSEMHARIRTSLSEEIRRLGKYLRGPYHGATRNTLVFLVMGHDGARGRMDLEGDRLRIAWPGFAQQPNYLRAEQQLKKATGELLGVYLRNPFNPITVHPLGGCPMGDDAESGVVDHESRVFARGAGTDVAHGLYVCDGSIVPRSLGINPLLTITALAERACALMAERHHWTIDYA
jgi:cholesterol oxidase